MLDQLAMFANIFLGAFLRGRRGRFYGITMLYRKHPGQLREDLRTVFGRSRKRRSIPWSTAPSRFSTPATRWSIWRRALWKAS